MSIPELILVFLAMVTILLIFLHVYLVSWEHYADLSAMEEELRGYVK